MIDYARLLAVALLAAVTWGYVHTAFSRKTEGHGRRLEKWAAVHHVRIKTSEYRWLLRGPFFFGPRGRSVYFLTVDMGDGAPRQVWVCFSSSLFGEERANHLWR
jgi:hypothetical protein